MTALNLVERVGELVASQKWSVRVILSDTFALTIRFFRVGDLREFCIFSALLFSETGQYFDLDGDEVFDRGRKRFGLSVEEAESLVTVEEHFVSWGDGWSLVILQSALYNLVLEARPVH